MADFSFARSQSMTRRLICRRRFVQSAMLAGAALAGKAGRGQQTPRGGAGENPLAAIVNKGTEFLRVKGQADDGSFSKQVGIGVTALACTALLRHGRSPEDPTVAQGLKFITDHAQ